MKNHLYQEFNKIYSREATNAYFSPGRVNLIGEHIDYNGGLVMPCAITFGTYLLVSPNNEVIFRFTSLNLLQKFGVSLQSGYTKNGDGWFNYSLGIIVYG